MKTTNGALLRSLYSYYIDSILGMSEETLLQASCLCIISNISCFVNNSCFLVGNNFFIRILSGFNFNNAIAISQKSVSVNFIDHPSSVSENGDSLKFNAIRISLKREYPKSFTT